VEVAIRTDGVAATRRLTEDVARSSSVDTPRSRHPSLLQLQQLVGNRAVTRLARAGGPRVAVQRDKAGPDEAQAEKIDQHPAWGSWRGGTGSVEGYQEIEANVTNSKEAGFYQSDEFRTWYFHGWRGVRKLANPVQALQYLATVLITDAAARSRLYADIKLDPATGRLGEAAKQLDEARKAGDLSKVGEIDHANAVDKAEKTGNFGALAQGRETYRSSGVVTFQRWTVNAVEKSLIEVYKIVNNGANNKKPIPETSREWKWIGADWSAGSLNDPRAGGKIPKKALGGASIKYFTLPDGQLVGEETWHGVDPAGNAKGNRYLRLLWSQAKSSDGIPLSDDNGTGAYAQWSAARLGRYSSMAKAAKSPKAKAPPKKPNTSPPPTKAQLMKEIGEHLPAKAPKIPEGASRRELHPIPGAVQEGAEFKWVDPAGGSTWRVRIHGPDPSAPPGSNAATGWVARIQKGKHYMDSSGTFHPPGIHNPASPHYNPKAINDTHIPYHGPKP
jgi:hypothetical protein